MSLAQALAKNPEVVKALELLFSYSKRGADLSGSQASKVTGPRNAFMKEMGITKEELLDATAEATGLPKTHPALQRWAGPGHRSKNPIVGMSGKGAKQLTQAKHAMADLAGETAAGSRSRARNNGVEARPQEQVRIRAAQDNLKIQTEAPLIEGASPHSLVDELQGRKTHDATGRMTASGIVSTAGLPRSERRGGALDKMARQSSESIEARLRNEQIEPGSLPRTSMGTLAQEEAQQAAIVGEPGYRLRVAQDGVPFTSKMDTEYLLGRNPKSVTISPDKAPVSPLESRGYPLGTRTQRVGTEFPLEPEMEARAAEAATPMRYAYTPGAGGRNVPGKPGRPELPGQPERMTQEGAQGVWSDVPAELGPREPVRGGSALASREDVGVAPRRLSQDEMRMSSDDILKQLSVPEGNAATGMQGRRARQEFLVPNELEGPAPPARDPFDRTQMFNEPSVPADRVLDMGWQKNIFGGGAPARGPTNVGVMEGPPPSQLRPAADFDLPTGLPRGRWDPRQQDIPFSNTKAQLDDMGISPDVPIGEFIPGGPPPGIRQGASSPARMRVGERAQPSADEFTYPNINYTEPLRQPVQSGMNRRPDLGPAELDQLLQLLQSLQGR